MFDAEGAAKPRRRRRVCLREACSSIRLRSDKRSLVHNTAACAEQPWTHGGRLRDVQAQPTPRVAARAGKRLAAVEPGALRALLARLEAARALVQPCSEPGAAALPQARWVTHNCPAPGHTTHATVCAGRCGAQQGGARSGGEGVAARRLAAAHGGGRGRVRALPGGAQRRAGAAAGAAPARPALPPRAPPGPRRSSSPCFLLVLHARLCAPASTQRRRLRRMRPPHAGQHAYSMFHSRHRHEAWSAC